MHRSSRRQLTSTPAIVSDNDDVDNLCKLIAQGNITSTLHQLEHHRKELNEAAYKTLLLTLTTCLNKINLDRICKCSTY